MSYDPGTPLPQDIPADSQDEFLTNFDTLNTLYGADHIPFGNKIQNATRANPCVITSANHRLVTGYNITINALLGLNDAGVETDWSINGNSYNVTVIDADSFSIPVDTSAEPEYIANSGNFLCNTASYRYGFHKKVTFSRNFNEFIPVFNQASNILIKNVTKKTITNIISGAASERNYLTPFFSNADVNSQLAEDIYQGVNTLGGFTTPWGLKINMGRIFSLANPTVTITLKVPYDTYHFTTIVSNVGASSGSFAVTTLTNTSFTVTNIPSNAFTDAYFISLGL